MSIVELNKDIKVTTNSAFFVLETGTSLFIMGCNLYPGSVELWFEGLPFGFSYIVDLISQVKFLVTVMLQWARDKYYLS